MTVVADFSGYATRNDVRCSDGRTILADAFKENHGQTVPLLWSHDHGDPTKVLGHVRLENVANGVKAHAFFNQTANGQHAKEMVKHGDVKFLSIFANQLVEQAKRVIKGNIREVSLVLAGANPLAQIDDLSIAHMENNVSIDQYGDVQVNEEEAFITTGLEIEIGEDIAHADSGTTTATQDTTIDKTLQDIVDTFNDEQMTVFEFVLSQALGEGDLQHSDTDGENSSEDDADAENDGEDNGDSSDANADDDSSSDGENSDDSGSDGSDDSEDADGENSDVDGSGVDTDDADNSDSTDDENNEDTENDDVDSNEDNNSSDDENNDDSEDSEDNDSDTDTDNEAGDNAVQHDNINQEDNSMTQNLFDQSQQDGSSTFTQKKLPAADVSAIMHSMDTNNSTLQAELKSYALQHGIENIEYLFPDPKLLSNSPNWLSRQVEWVKKVLDGVNKTPFSRIRTITADITADEARARGYVKGNEKVEEMFTLLKRDTTPQTIYKRQELHRDDVLDITDLDVIAWMKAEMKMMMDEEIAGAILIGDGRSNGDNDKIKVANVRPIATDDELYAPTFYVNLDDASSSIEELVDKVIESRQYYRGTGVPTFYTSEAFIAKFLQVKDGFQHRMYKSLDEIAVVLRVKEVVAVDVFNRDASLVGIMVNLADYSIGTDRGGQATMFDDFDLKFNKLQYLLETRLSGALTLPKSALVFRKVAAGAALVTPVEPGFASHTVTVATTTGVTYKNKDTNATLVTGTPIVLGADDTLNVLAIPASGSYYLADNVNDEWHYDYDGKV